MSVTKDCGNEISAQAFNYFIGRDYVLKKFRVTAYIKTKIGIIQSWLQTNENTYKVTANNDS